MRNLNMQDLDIDSIRTIPNDTIPMTIPNTIKRSRRSKRGLYVVLLLALLSVGCTGLPVQPTPATTPEIPDQWHGLQDLQESTVQTADPSPEEITAWWRRLEDPVLDQLVAVAVADSLTLQSAAARVAEARARRGLLKADLGPTVSAGLSASTREPLADGAGGELFSGSFETAWEADLFGAKRLSLRAGESDLAASVEDLHGARVSLVAEVVIAYTDLRVAEARLRVVDDNLESREETYSLTNFREQAGLTTALDVSQALSNLEQTRANRVTVELGRTNAELRLALLLGQTPGTLDSMLAAESSAEPSVDLPTPPQSVTVGLPADALRRRPDVRAAGLRLDGALARVGAAEAARYPTLRLTGSLDGQSADLEDLFDVDSFLANLLAGLTAPIFQSGRIEQNILLEETRLEQSALAYGDSILQALSEVESALASWHSIRHQIDALDRALAAAREAAELADQRYEAGLVDLLVVLDSQRSLLSLEEQHVAARGERAIAFANLYRALGGGWISGPTDSAATSGASNV